MFAIFLLLVDAHMYMRVCGACKWVLSAGHMERLREIVDWLSRLHLAPLGQGLSESERTDMPRLARQWAPGICPSLSPDTGVAGTHSSAQPFTGR